MLVNAILIPFFLGIFTNVSKESDFDPEYLYEMNKLTITYKPHIESAQLSSRITCHPFLTDTLRCFVHDIKYVTSINRTSDMNNRIEVGQWFEMKFIQYSREVQNILVTEKEPTKLIKSFMKDIIHQFNVGNIDDIENANDTHAFKKDGYIGWEKTPIGRCVTTYLTAVGRYKKDAYEKTDSSFQIRLLNGHFDQKDIHVLIAKDRRDCLYLPPFSDFLGKREMILYNHIIEVIGNKLRMYTILEGKRPIYLSNNTEIFDFSQIMDLQLINVTSKKTISFQDHNSTKFDY